MTEFNSKDTALFMQLVMTFQAAAWQQMGKIKNPINDKIERSLDQARYSIDMLEMLRSKTKGNLAEDELKFVNHVMTELQLNFVDELNKDKARPEEKAKSAEKDAAEEKEKPEPREKNEEKKEKAG
jgi:uncharacterized membrane protein YukC